jgi:hypothetical protein
VVCLFFRAAFGKESEVLIGNLGDKLIPPQDILRDVSDLKALANMHESLEWLAGRTKSAFSNLSTSQSKCPGGRGELPDDGRAGPSAFIWNMSVLPVI